MKIIEKTHPKLTDLQKEVLVGILLGDAHIAGRVKVEQGNLHKVYAQHLFDQFRPWIQASHLRKREVRLGKQDKIHTNWCFTTITHPCFLFYEHQFYEVNQITGKRRRRLPPVIHRLLTPRALAYWYMHDGSMKSKQSKGVIFNRQSFSFLEVCTLSKVLDQQFQLKSWPRKQKEGYQLYISGHSYERLRELIYPFLIPEMEYKFPLPRIRGLRLTQLPKE